MAHFLRPISSLFFLGPAAQINRPQTVPKQAQRPRPRTHQATFSQQAVWPFLPPPHARTTKANVHGFFYKACCTSPLPCPRFQLLFVFIIIIIFLLCFFFLFLSSMPRAHAYMVTILEPPTSSQPP